MTLMGEQSLLLTIVATFRYQVVATNLTTTSLSAGKTLGDKMLSSDNSGFNGSQQHFVIPVWALLKCAYRPKVIEIEGELLYF
jgi:hypothetical protein